MLRHVTVACALLVGTGAALAQSAHIAQPYAELTTRAIKALSAEQVADLRAGRGMGLALAAELNGYPGPSHVLEQADALGLAPAQRARTAALFDAMRAEVVPLGERVIESEVALDALFAHAGATPASLDAATTAIGTAQSALRAAHLRYHVTMLEVLTPEQVQRYAGLRGYGAAVTPPAAHGGRAH